MNQRRRSIDSYFDASDASTVFGEIQHTKNVPVALVALLHDSNRTAVTNSRVGKDRHSVKALRQVIW